MDYIIHRRFKSTALCGPVNLPSGTKCVLEGEYITLNGKPLCAVKSDNAHQYFARNDDGLGLERGKLTQQIQIALAKRDDKHQARWNRVWADFQCHLYRRTDHKDFWLWDHKFFEAPIEVLERIFNLIREV